MRLAVLLAAGVWIGCADDGASGHDWTNGPVIYDFVANFPAATSDRDTEHIDLGTPAARGHLLAGWRTDRPSARGMTTVLGVGPGSTLEFLRAEPRRIEVTFRCLQIAGDTMSVNLNGHLQRSVKLKPGWRKYRVLFPREAVQPGPNVVRLTYGYGQRALPPPGASFERRQAAIECDDVRFAGRDGPPSAIPSVEGDDLVIPVGKQVDYHVKVPSRTGFTFRGPLASGILDARLQVWVQQDGSADGVRADLAATAPPSNGAAAHAIALPESGSRIMRISLRAVADSGAPSSASTVRLVGPVIRTVPRAKASRPFGRDAGQEPPDVFIYLIDTLRTDHLGCYGHPGNVSPHIDAFAEDGVLFERAIANSPWTKPSVASLFTGVWPATHNVVAKGQSLPGEALTLAEALRPAGIQTVGFVANGHVTDRFGFDQGFDRFVFLQPPDQTRVPPGSDLVNRQVFDWLSERAAEGPLFLYVHTVDPHVPYDPPARFRSAFASAVRDPHMGSREALHELHEGNVTDDLIRDLKALYAAEVAFNDESFGLFLERLKALGRYDDALIVLLADHGEAFHEHGVWEHGRDVHGEVVNVPVIVKFPAREGLAGRRIAALAQQVDIMPTILEYLGLPVPSEVEGRSLLRLLAAGEATTDEQVGFTHLHQIGRHQEAVTDESWKLIRDAGAPLGVGYALYDLAADPGERADVLDRHPIVAAYLKEQLQLRRVRTGAVLTPTMGVTDAAVEDNLRALGYIE
jgi:arylsulfatase A-like enzyme